MNNVNTMIRRFAGNRPLHHKRCVLALRRYASPAEKSKNVNAEESTQEKSIHDVIPIEKSEIRSSSAAAYTSLPDTHVRIKGLERETPSSMLIRECLQQSPDKEGLIAACDAFIEKTKKDRRGSTEFVETALKFIDPYKMSEQIEVYNKLIDVFPREKLRNKNMFEAFWPKPHPQMHTTLLILKRMEDNFVRPDDATHELCYEIFGRGSFPCIKIYRSWFWMDNFADVNPYRVEDEVYTDKRTIYTEVLKRCESGYEATGENITTFEISDPVEDDADLRKISIRQKQYTNYIMSSQTPTQRTLLDMCSVDNPLYVEGPVHIWMNRAEEEYFVLKTGAGDLVSTEDVKVDEDEEREGVVLATCVVNRPYTSSLQKWINYLQETNERLRDCNIIFNITERNETTNNLEEITSGS